MKTGGLLVAAVAAVLLIAAPAGGAAKEPTVLCKKATVPGEVKVTDPGIYSYRPHTCVLNYFEAPAPAAVFFPLRAITWKRWDSETASGVGIHLIPRVRPGGPREGFFRERVAVTLSHPLTICGHTVFTAARIVWQGAPFDEHTKLDRVPVAGQGC
jgi:hypothetical protein